MVSILQDGILSKIGYTSPAKFFAFMVLYAFIAILIGYLLGSINSAIVVSKLLYGEDVRTKGSHNAGLTNMLRVYGKKAALFTLLGDVTKTLLALFISALLFGYNYHYLYSASVFCYISGLFTILGHVFPVYYKFKGGKGVLCTATVVAMLSIKTFTILIALFILIVLVTKYVSLGSCTTALIYPFLFSRMVKIKGGQVDLIIITIMIIEALFIVWCHRANIDRLRKGEENKLSFKSKKKETEVGTEEERV